MADTIKIWKEFKKIIPIIPQKKARPQKYQSDMRNEYAITAILLTLICNPEI